MRFLTSGDIDLRLFEAKKNNGTLHTNVDFSTYFGVRVISPYRAGTRTERRAKRVMWPQNVRTKSPTAKTPNAQKRGVEILQLVWCIYTEFSRQLISS